MISSRLQSCRRTSTLALGLPLCLLLAPLSTTALAATMTKTPSATVQEATPKVVLPQRDALMVIDWVDVNAARLSVGGVTYSLKGQQPKIVLASGDAVTTIGYLKPGMRAHIETAMDAASGQARMTAIRVEP